ncbi:hypothetical protein ABHI18_004586 [Aspergillus niger]
MASLRRTRQWWTQIGTRPIWLNIFLFQQQLDYCRAACYCGLSQCCMAVVVVPVDFNPPISQQELDDLRMSRFRGRHARRITIVVFEALEFRGAAPTRLGEKVVGRLPCGRASRLGTKVFVGNGHRGRRS